MAINPCSIPNDPAVQPGLTHGQAPDRGETLRVLAAQFESLLLSQMLRDMQSESKSAEGNMFGGLTDTMYSELAGALVKAGGIGLATSLEEAMARTTPGGEMADAIAHGEAPPMRQYSPWLPEGPLSLALDPDRISSAYGVRRDPISGVEKMHAGVDIPMPQGADVRTLKGGVVVSSGNVGGYGQTIVVDHGDGLTTRYAHLSARHVQEGDRVATGQVVGLAGQTGRATGPHLHLEVREHGRAIDPFGPESGRLLGNVAAVPQHVAVPADDDRDGVRR